MSRSAVNFLPGFGGQPVAGLYAAGRCTAGLCREGRNYASGLSIGEGSFFGRLAGRSVAAAEPWGEAGS